MQYVGSKARIKKEVLPIIQSKITDATSAYIEPFVGGANLIDSVEHEKRIGYDINEYLIELLNYIKVPENRLPESISFEEYKLVKSYPERYMLWYIAIVGFCATFSNMWMGSFARNKRGDNSDLTKNISSIRNLEKQRCKLKDIAFVHGSYTSVDINIKNAVIYCDPPYRGTVKYKDQAMDYELFYKWCEMMAQNNTVLVSEYCIKRESFKEIWSKEIKNQVGFERSARVERLYEVRI